MDCDMRDRIIDAECCYDNGKFYMGRLPGCLPKLFTVRFTAPADYNAGDVIVVNDKELPVRTPGMTSATSGLFMAGAVMHCDVDLDRKLAFFWQSGSVAPMPWVIGQAIPYMGSLSNLSLFAPYFLVADGAAVSRAVYPELFTAIGVTYGAGDGSTTFNLPDLRGMFVRGLDAGRGIDPGRVLGEQQGDAMRNFTGRLSVNADRGIFQGASGVFTASGKGKWAAGSVDTGNNWMALDLDPSLMVPTADENRPVNMPCNWLICAKAPSVVI